MTGTERERDASQSLRRRDLRCGRSGSAGPECTPEWAHLCSHTLTQAHTCSRCISRSPWARHVTAGAGQQEQRSRAGGGREGCLLSTQCADTGRQTDDQHRVPDPGAQAGHMGSLPVGCSLQSRYPCLVLSHLVQPGGSVVPASHPSPLHPPVSPSSSVTFLPESRSLTQSLSSCCPHLVALTHTHPFVL